MASITLRPGREASVQRRHPWIFAGAVKSQDEKIGLGETVDVFSCERQWLATGAWSPHSQIRVRLWSFEAGEEISSQFFRQRLHRAVHAREVLFKESTSAYRLVNAESDGLPGLTVDRYDDYLVCQFFFAGVERWKEVIIQQLSSLLPGTSIYERSEGEPRQKEGLEPCNGVLAGAEPPDLIEISERGLRVLVDVRRGQKTGYFLDQRDNRALVPDFSSGAEVLNCFAYTGSFGLWALKGGAARVINIDSSPAALSLAQSNLELNRFDSARMENSVADVFQVLRSYRDARRSFDLIILDPPKFAATAHQVKKASRGYKDINLLALKLLRPGGMLFTFSCSGHIKTELFQKIVADAALDADRDVQIIKHLSQSSDHPVALSFPEGLYLKGLICRAW